MVNHLGVKFKDLELIFEDDRIYYEIVHENQIVRTGNVMMNWEDKLMKAHADIACHNRGDVLEIGFGMGISADYIQANNPKSHTIIELHPQVITRLKKWSEDKPNVIVVEGDWRDQIHKLPKYDGVFFDNYSTGFRKFGQIVGNHTKKGAKVTFWNNNPRAGEIYHRFPIKKVRLTPIEVNPDPNEYFPYSTYHLPEVQY